MVVVFHVQAATDPPVLFGLSWQYVVQPYGLPAAGVGENVRRFAPVAFAKVTSVVPFACDVV